MTRTFLSLRSLCAIGALAFTSAAFAAPPHDIGIPNANTASLMAANNLGIALTHPDAAVLNGA